MDNLPQEIKICILESLEADCGDDHRAKTIALSSLRLVCRTWSQLPLPYLFRTISYTLEYGRPVQYNSILCRLWELKECTEIAAYVHHLRLNFHRGVGDGRRLDRPSPHCDDRWCEGEHVDVQPRTLRLALKFECLRAFMISIFSGLRRLRCFSLQLSRMMYNNTLTTSTCVSG